MTIQENEMLSSLNQKDEIVTIDPLEEELKKIMGVVESMYNSVLAMQMGLKSMGYRLDQTEKFVSYLIAKDPEMREKIEKMSKEVEQVDEK